MKRISIFKILFTVSLAGFACAPAFAKNDFDSMLNKRTNFKTSTTNSKKNNRKMPKKNNKNTNESSPKLDLDKMNEEEIIKVLKNTDFKKILANMDLNVLAKKLAENTDFNKIIKDTNFKKLFKKPGKEKNDKNKTDFDFSELIKEKNDKNEKKEIDFADMFGEEGSQDINSIKDEGQQKELEKSAKSSTRNKYKAFAVHFNNSKIGKFSDNVLLATAEFIKYHFMKNMSDSFKDAPSPVVMGKSFKYVLIPFTYTEDSEYVKKEDNIEEKNFFGLGKITATKNDRFSSIASDILKEIRDYNKAKNKSNIDSAIRAFINNIDKDKEYKGISLSSVKGCLEAFSRIGVTPFSFLNKKNNPAKDTEEKDITKFDRKTLEKFLENNEKEDVTKTKETEPKKNIESEDLFKKAVMEKLLENNKKSTKIGSKQSEKSPKDAYTKMKKLLSKRRPMKKLSKNNKENKNISNEQIEKFLQQLNSKKN